MILGMHRSGTSAVGGLLNRMGLYCGEDEELMPPAPDNPSGFWERLDVCQLNEDMLRSVGAAWDDVLDFRPDAIPEAEKAVFGERIQAIVAKLAVRPPWFVKDPRMCLTFPLWHPHMPGTVCVLVYRDPVQVAKSLETRNGYPLSFGVALWEVYTARVLGATGDLPRFVVSYEKLMGDPLQEAERLRALLQGAGVQGLRTLGTTELAETLKSELFHESATRCDSPALLSKRQMDLAAALAEGDLSFSGGGIEPSEAAIEQLGNAKGFRNFRVKADELRVANGELRSETRRLRETVGALQSEARQLREANEGLESEARQLREANEGLESEARQLRETNEGLRSETQRLQEAHGGLRSEVQRLQETVDELQDERIQLREEVGDLRIERQQLQASIVVSARGSSALQMVRARDADQFHHYVALMREGFDVTFSSVRWRLGNALVRPLEIALGRFEKRTPEDFIEQVLREYDDWRGERDSRDPSLPAALKVPDRLRLLLGLLGRLFRDPVGSLKLFTLSKAAFILSGLVSGDRDKCRQITESLETPAWFDPAQLRKHEGRRRRWIDWQKGRVSFPPVQNPLVSVIVPVHNHFQMTMTCLKSLSDCGSSIPFEVIVADDASTDEVRGIEECLENVTVVRSSRNLGFLDNCNQAAHKARGRYLVFLNNDTVVAGKWLDHLVGVAERHEKAGVVGPKLLNADGTLQEAGGIIWKDGHGWNYGRGEDPGRSEYNYVKEVDFVSGACLLTPAKLWRQIGGFDQRYSPAYYEDVDYAFEARRRGYSVLYQPKAVVSHLEGVSHGTDVASGIKQCQETNREKFRAKWGKVLQKDQARDNAGMFHARDRSAKRKTVLVIDHYVPHFDRDAGSKSIYRYLRLFSDSGLNVKFMGDNHFPHEPYTTCLTQGGIEVLHGQWYAANWRRYLAEHLQHIDYLFLCRPHIAVRYLKVLEKRKSTKVYYLGIDIHHIRVQRQKELQGGSGLNLLARELERQETAILKSVDKSYFFSEYEVSYLSERHPALSVGYLPLYFYESAPADLPRFREREGLFFVAGFRHEPNEDGIRWFLDEVFPLVRDRGAGLHLTIAGANMPKWLLGRRQEGVSVLGEISDAELARRYERARLIVAPLRFGAGVKGKVIEGARHGVPVVTTSIGAEGIPGASSFLIIEDDPGRQAEAIAAIHHDEQAWSLHSRRGLEAIDTYFSKKVAVDILRRDMGIDL